MFLEKTTLAFSNFLRVRDSHPGFFYKTVGTYSFSLESATLLVCLEREDFSKMVAISKNTIKKG